MNMKFCHDEIDYDKLIDYELSCLNDNDSDLDEKPFLENKITDDDTYDTVLDKISEAHEEFYKTCFQNATFDDENYLSKSQELCDDPDHRTMQILKSHSVTYEDFVLTLPKINDEFEKSFNLEASINQKEDNGPVTTSSWIDHENVLRQINEEKWNQYDSFYNKFNERCESARILSKKELENQLLEEKSRREILQSNMDTELKILEQRWSLEEAENKLKMIEIEAEIEEEKKVMVQLKQDHKELIEYKHERAAIIIQKVFRRYRIRKRIGAQIDEVREKARKKLFNRKLIISEKESQKKRAAELRKWKKDRDKKSLENKTKTYDERPYTELTIDEEDKYLDNVEEEVSLNSEICNQTNNNNVFDGVESELICSKVGLVIQPNELKSDSMDDCIVDPGELLIGVDVTNEIKEMKIEYLARREEKHAEENIEACDENVVDDGNSSGNGGEIKCSDDCSKLEMSDVDAGVKVDKTEECEFNIEDSIENRDESRRAQIADLITEYDTRGGINDDSIKIDDENMGNIVSITETRDLNKEEKIGRGDESNTDEIGSITSVFKLEDEDIIDKINSEASEFNDVLKIVRGGESSTDNIGDVTSVCDTSRDKIKMDDEDVNYDMENMNSSNETCDANSEEKTGRGEESNGDNIGGITSVLKVEDADIIDKIGSKTRDFNDEEKIKRVTANSLDFTECGEGYNQRTQDLERESNVKAENDETMMLVNKRDDRDRLENQNSFCTDSENGNNIESKEICMTIVAEKDFLNITQDIGGEGSDKEELSVKIDEDYVRDILSGNEALTKLCVKWMHHKVKERGTKSDEPNCQERRQSVPCVPKHLKPRLHISQICQNRDSSTVIVGPQDMSSHRSLVLSDMAPLSSHDSDRVQYLTINDTPLTSFHSHDLPQSLLCLDLDRNKLEWAYFGWSGASNLSTISCKNNDLADLPPGAFRSCQSLTYLDLSNNNFLSIKNIFKDTEPLENLCYVNLSGNVLSSMETLQFHCPRLTHLRLSNNHVKIWRSGEEFPLMVECDLSNNSLSKIETLSDTPLLARLDISNNSISSLTEFAQSWMPCLSELLLDSNKFTELQELHFPLLQIISLRKNYIEDSMDVDGVFKDCPLISTIDLSQNISPIRSLSGKLKDSIINDQDPRVATRVPCPVGNFATACYDFVDSIRTKSQIMESNLRVSASIEVSHKHQYHFYRSVRDAVDDFSDWMTNLVFQHNSESQDLTNTLEVFDQREIEAVVKIQAFWKGYRARRWFKGVLKDINFESDKGLDPFPPAELSEFDESYFLGKWGGHCTLTEGPRDAWVKGNLIEVVGGGNDIPRTGRKDSALKESNYSHLYSCETSYRSNSAEENHDVVLGRKGREIMKEWGFEDPNSAKWMLQRAKRLRNVSEKCGRRRVQETKGNSSHNQRPPKAVPPEAAPVSTITLQSPCMPTGVNCKANVYAWLCDTDSVTTIESSNRSFLPSIGGEHAANKTALAPARRDSSTKLPPISTAHTNK